MKKTILFTILALIVNVFCFSQSDAEIKNEQEAIKKVIQSAYVDGLQNEGDMAKIDAGFHPSFNLLGIGQGQTIWALPIYTWKENVLRDKANGKIPRTGDKQVNIKFLNVDVTGTAAMAKIEFYVGTKLTYVDYLSLYKFEDNWKIVSKIFYKFPEASK